MNAEEQRSNLSLRYAESVFGIMTQNEKLPEYMADRYALAPFKPVKPQDQDGEKWVAPTTLYSVDLKCEEAKKENSTEEENLQFWVSSDGCNYMVEKIDNATIGTYGFDEEQSDLNIAVKEYSSIYVGFGNRNDSQRGLEDWYCPAGQVNPHTFYAAFIQNKKRTSDPPGKSANLFCIPHYYSQEVLVAVDAVNKHPDTSTGPDNASYHFPLHELGPKKDLPADIFDTIAFEYILTVGAMDKEIRGALPTLDLPSYTDTPGLENITLTNYDSSYFLHPMAALALLMDGDSPENYLEPSTLESGYEAAYRLMFSRAMVQVLGSKNFSSSHRAMGNREITTQALVIVPVFVYIVVSFLAIVSTASLVMLVFTMRRLNLASNPATIAAIMSLTADEEPLLEDLALLNAKTIDDMRGILGDQRYQMVDDGSGNAIFKVGQATIDTAGAPEVIKNTDTAQTIRPKEFRWYVAAPFFVLHVILAIVLAILLWKNKPNGLPLPSQNKTVQNLLENYIPTAVATLIEPMWILVNRLLCLLQPLEELRKGRARARASIDLDYASLPPQLTIFKALRSRHFVLAAVCFMALLANILAVAFAGLFNHEIRAISRPASWRQIYQPKFVAIDGSIGPNNAHTSFSTQNSGAFKGGKGTDQFLIAESNYTSGTAMPAWMDSKMMYLPFELDIREGELWRGKTHAFGAEIECSPQRVNDNFTASLYIPVRSPPALRMNFSASVRSDSGDIVTCSSDTLMQRGPSTGDQFIYECQKGLVAAEFVLPLQARENATIEEIDTCAGRVFFGYVRRGGGTCFPSLDANTTLTDDDSLFVGCKPKLKIGEATIEVGNDSRLTKPATDVRLFDLTTQEQEKYFSNASSNVIEQSNRYLFVDNDVSRWHNDTYANQMINHFIRRRNGSRLLDPNMIVPTFDEVYQPLQETYSYLFATWLAINYQSLFTKYPGPEDSAPDVDGTTMSPEERVLLSTPMVVIAEGILCCYAIVAIFVYLRRPGAYLARLPTCVASIIALFASSAAVQDMRGTSRYSKKERSQHLEELDQRYAYGSYVGGDGKVHIGIEKSHFVNVQATTTWLEKNTKTRQRR
jgi:hypothetical protein